MLGGLYEEMPFRDSSFDEFVAAHVRDLMHTAYLIVCDESEAEDLVQESLLRVAKRWPRVRAMDRPAAYARRILVNLAIDGARGQTRRRQELDHAAGADPTTEVWFDVSDGRTEAALDAVAQRGLLLDALRQLSPRQRAVIVLRYFHDLSEAETARLLGCSVGTVKGSSSRGLERLRDLVEPQRTRSGDGAAHIRCGGTEA